MELFMFILSIYKYFQHILLHKWNMWVWSSSKLTYGIHSAHPSTRHECFQHINQRQLWYVMDTSKAYTPLSWQWTPMWASSTLQAFYPNCLVGRCAVQSISYVNLPCILFTHTQSTDQIKDHTMELIKSIHIMTMSWWYILLTDVMRRSLIKLHSIHAIVTTVV